MTITPVQTLGTIVADNPALAADLDKLGLDYCCHGDRSLAEACAASRLDIDTVLGRLRAVTDQGDVAWAALDLVGLVEHLLATHHAYLHDELPALEALADKVHGAHAERHPELDEVVSLVRALRADLEPHLAKEERVLFPAIRALVAGRYDLPFGSIENPIRVMAAEHDNVGALLARLRGVTTGFAVPPDGCASYTSLYARLEALELDTHLHVHKENHALFPRAAELHVAVQQSASHTPMG